MQDVDQGCETFLYGAKRSYEKKKKFFFNVPKSYRYERFGFRFLKNNFFRFRLRYYIWNG